MGIVILILTIVGALILKNMMGGGEFMEYYQKSLEILSGETVEYVRGMQVVKIFGATVESFKTLYKAIKDYSKYALDYSISSKNLMYYINGYFWNYCNFVYPFSFYHK